MYNSTLRAPELHFFRGRDAAVIFIFLSVGGADLLANGLVQTNELELRFGRIVS